MAPLPVMEPGNLNSPTPALTLRANRTANPSLPLNDLVNFQADRGHLMVETAQADHLKSSEVTRPAVRRLSPSNDSTKAPSACQVSVSDTSLTKLQSNKMQVKQVTPNIQF